MSPKTRDGRRDLADPPSVPIDIELHNQSLRFPRLMDQDAVDELEKRGLKAYPAFRIRAARRVSFDLQLPRAARFAWSGGLVAHSWWIAAPPELPRLTFKRAAGELHRCQLLWTETGGALAGEQRSQRYLELHHLELAPAVPIVVIAKPALSEPALSEPAISEPLAAELPRAASSEAGRAESGLCSDEGPVTFKVSFREIEGEVRPWFDLFLPDLFPAGVEPEPVLETTSSSYTLALELTAGEFVADKEGAPLLRWYDAEGPLSRRPDHITAVGIESGHRLVMSWLNPPPESVTSFDVLCRYRDEEIWFDPTLYHKGIGLRRGGHEDSAPAQT